MTTIIPKEKLIELYINNNKTMNEIAKIYQVDRTTISNKLKMFDIKINKQQRKYTNLKTIPLTELQKELIVGSCLGDASLIKNQRRITSYFKVAHCEKQKDYLLYKKTIFNNIVNNITKNIDKRGNSIMYGFNTLSHPEFNFYRDLFYDNNIKIIKPEIGNYLTSFGLAIWFMDDGSRGKTNYTIATDGFTEKENIILTDILKTNFNIEAKVCNFTRKNKTYYYLYINKHNSLIMSNVIKPYIVDCMKYKLI